LTPYIARETTPSASITKVERRIPMRRRPYIVFSRHTS
jgi:hypothetical protein